MSSVPLGPEIAGDLPLLTKLQLAVEELLFGFGGGRNRTKGGAALDKVDAGQLPRMTYFSTSLNQEGETGHLPGWMTW